MVNDIVGAMFNSKFVEELFRPQELYPKKAVKHIFEKLAHSSIMRLNEASMDKVRILFEKRDICIDIHVF